MNMKTILAAALAASSALAQGLNYPADLQPGDEYRVLFVTDSTRDAATNWLPTYDAFVTADADAVPFLASLGTNWRVVGSSATVSAKDHTDTASGGVPIYRPDGVRIADGYDQLWDAANTPLLAAPEVTASGVLTADLVWTGTMADGSSHSWPLGGLSQQVVAGRADLTGLDWVSGNTRPLTESHRLFGISDVMRVPHPDYPQDLKPGDQFRVLFVTDATRDATSANIQDYDDFVTADLQGSPELLKYRTNWRAVASTPSVSAKAHTETTGTGLPIYRPDGVRAFDSYVKMWQSGSPTVVLAAPNVTASGLLTSASRVWTGTGGSGSALSSLGNSSGNSMSGDPAAANYSWVWANSGAQTSLRPLYGISDVITVPEAQHPAGLQPGDQYRILFVTDATRDATSADIADYDDFVRADADAVPAMRLYATEWHAVVSTPSVSAIVHTGTVGAGGVPIYRPDGVRIADDYELLWSNWLQHLAEANITSRGQPTPWSRAWTGTWISGTTSPNPLGAAGGMAQNGNPTALGYGWITANLGAQADLWPLYGISDVITVPYPSVEQSRVGTPPNADALLPGQTSAPVIGQTWDPIVDHTTYVPTALLDALFLGAAQANVPLPGFGTVLIDQLLGDGLTALPGQTFALAIPDEVGLLGVSLSAQALTLDGAFALHLTNAIDFTIGTR